MNDQALDLKPLDEMGPLIARTQTVRRQTRLIRIGFVLLVLVTILGWLWATYSHIRSLDVEKLGEEFGKRAEKTWPYISDELGKLVDAVLPVVEASVVKELEEAGPDIAKRFEEEASLLEEGLKKAVEDTLRRHLTKENRAEAIGIVRAAFPEYGDEQKTDDLVAALQDSFLKYAQKKLLTMLAEYYDTLRKFEKTFNQIRAGIPEGQRPATLEAVLELWLEVMYEKMGGDSELEVSKPATQVKKKGRK